MTRYHRAQVRPKPLAELIAAEIVKHSAILNLRTPRLVLDIRARFACCHETALAALEIAREAV